MMRFCPNCETERPIEEWFCEGVVDDAACQWELSALPIREVGDRPQEIVTKEERLPVPAELLCTNGHQMDAGDLMCLTCGADPASHEHAPITTVLAPPASEETQIDGWRLLRRISNTDSVRERYISQHCDTNRQAVLTLYRPGAEPDPAVYEVIGRLPREHVPEIITTGRWDGRAYEVAEELSGGTLADVGIAFSDMATIRHVISELGRALHCFSEAGLRHRDLRPGTLLVRSRDPLDLVVSGFGSARLSEFDLDIVSPLETSRYMAPEAIAGGVAAASDWWSLGMILLEQLTNGACFAGSNPQSFLIHVLANGITLPDDLDPQLHLLFRGLLARDRHQRWQWQQVRRWLDGEAVDAPSAVTPEIDSTDGNSIVLNKKSYHKPAVFALAAAESEHWNEAKDHLRRGVLTTWAEQAKVAPATLAGLRQVVQLEGIDDDCRLMIALKLLNPEIPLILRGEIVTPGWLLQNGLEAYDLITGAVPVFLQRMQTETWLSQLRSRAEVVRLRAANLGIELNEETVRINLLSTSRARLAAVWDQQRLLFPDSDHPGILSLSERRTISEEDLIVLLSAAVSQFRSVDAVLEQARDLAKQEDILSFDPLAARAELSLLRTELFRTVDDRIAGFARTGKKIIDDLAEQFRLERRLPLHEIILILAVPADQWLEPQKQQYVSQILDFFEKKLSSAVLRGPLVRMTIGKSTGRADMAELSSPRQSGAALLEHLLQRNSQSVAIDPGILAENLPLVARLNTLHRQTSIYKRDTGIDGLYLGFPFLIIKDNRSKTRPRVTPVLLWPVKLLMELGARGQIALAFDTEREEVRINPALEGLLGREAVKDWRSAADEVLGRSALKLGDVLDAFGMLATPEQRQLTSLPAASYDIPAGTASLRCSAVLFHVTFSGQAIGEDLRQLKTLPPSGTALESMLRLKEKAEFDAPLEQAAEIDRYLTVASDPSQESAVLKARQWPGLLVEGPPGTGKSQTIVNMVADAIGRKKSMLIVCQKHAALEVVYKRLVAEGLGDRIIMVNDVNKDREPTIRAVREQLDGMFKGSQFDNGWVRQRERVAAKIEALEGELDRLHQALHQVDEATGLSYRALLGQLIELEVGSPPLNMPQLRTKLSSLDSSGLTTVEEECAPLARYWLPAKFEGSALAQLKAFATDRGTLDEFHVAFRTFLDAEHSRMEILDQHPTRFDVDDPAPHRAWLNQNAPRLEALDESQRKRLAHWLPLFRPADKADAPGQLLYTALQNLHQELRAISGAGYHGSLSRALASLPGPELVMVEQQTSLAARPLTFFDRLNPFTYVRRNQALKFAAQAGVPLAEWLGEGQRLVLLGEAGCGKSTLLRVVALDLLHGQEHFPELAARWGQHIPIYIPFARWSSQVARDGNAIGIKEIVRRSLEQFLTGSIVDLLDRAINDQRVVVLIDGLDEWGSEQAARATLSALVTTVEAHGLPVIVSGRPRGLSRIGALPTNWKRGTVASLSVAQQAKIAERWFERYASAQSSGIPLSEARLRTGRFMAELVREANLGALATVPLLLIGLVTLALRGQILPRTRTEIYDQLVRILLEVHPTSRATASGDTQPRFRHATDPTQRRAAIARLAFAVRQQTGGAGMPLAAARDILRTYLASPLGFDFAEADAGAAADEILSVNAETQGLIIENAPGEVGFVHASFEEFLGAEHVGGWPFSNIEAFVSAHAGEGRWRNVISNLLGRIQRRDEFDQLVAVIETTDSDEVARYHRQFLLGDIAFGAVVRSTAAAKRLALATMSRVETEDWLPARREALASVVKGLADPTLKAEVEQRLARWLPARLSYTRASLIEAFGVWEPTKQLEDFLFQAMYDEDRGVQRAAAAAYAKAFSSSAEACQRLLDGLARTRDLAAAAALLESLALGWPDEPDAGRLFGEAWSAHGAELCLVGILGLAVTGAATDEARDAVLRGQSFWSDISYPYNDLATAMLMKYWPGDEALIKSALRRLSGDFDSIWEHDVARAYVMTSPVDRADVRAWVSAEFDTKFPFNDLGHGALWQQVGRFAATDPEIRAAANAYWCKAENRLINMLSLQRYVAWVADPPIATVLIEVLREKQNKFNRYWAMNALLAGWGRDHPHVKPAIDALATAADEDLDDLAPFLPEIMQDKPAARQRLIRMSTRSELRRDLLATGLAACGCDASDNEAVAAILAFPEQLRGMFDPSYVLFRTFGKHASVRALAAERIREADGPLAAIAAAYADDTEFGPALFDAAVPLPLELRTQIVEVAAAGATGTALEAVLSRAMLETDPELRARMVIAHYRALPPEEHETARQALLAKAVAVGPDYQSVRAAALAGLVTIGELGSLAPLEERGQPIALLTGGFNEGIGAVERLVCERFAEFDAVFGDNLPERFKSLGDSGKLSAILSAAPGASPAARAAFLALAERDGIPHTVSALRALAAERPSSDLLLAYCWDTLGSEGHGNNNAMFNADVGLILREHFSGNASVRQKLVERFKAAPSVANAIPLAIFAPDVEELSFPIEFEVLGENFADWAVAAHVAARRADSATFCKLLEAVVSRQSRSQFDAQHITNLAVEERLLRDSALEGLMSARIEKTVDPSISGSFARYLAAAGKLNLEARGNALELLAAFGANQRLPVAGYDAIADQWRAARATLLDAVSAGLEVG